MNLLKVAGLCLTLLSMTVSAATPDESLQRLRTLTQAAGQHEAEVGRLIRQMLPVASEDQLLEAWDLLEVFRRRIAAEVGVPVPDNAGPGFAAGVELARQAKVPPDEVVAVLIREADLLRPAAQEFLQMIYVTPIEGFKLHDPAILAWVQRTAAEKLPASRRFLGRILLYGLGVPADEERGRLLLEELDSGEGLLELAQYETALGNRAEALSYLQRAAEEYRLAGGWYNLGIDARHNGRLVQARDYFSRALELDPNYHPATIELGLLLAAGKGGPRDSEQAAALMRRVVDGAQGRERYIAMANLGYYLMHGIGVPPDPITARRYLQQAADNGIEEASSLLQRLKR